MDIKKINDEIRKILTKHAQLMPEFANVPASMLERRLNHLSVPLAYREVRIRGDE